MFSIKIEFPQQSVTTQDSSSSIKKIKKRTFLQNCHFAHFHHMAAVRADTRGYSSCIGIQRAPCQQHVPSAYRQPWPFPSSLRRSLKYQAEVTHPGLMLILPIMTKDKTLNIPHIANSSWEWCVSARDSWRSLYIYEAYPRMTELHMEGFR